MLDNYTFGEVERISPEAPVPVVLVRSQRIKLGGAANVADNLSGLKNNTILCGAIGNDQNADLLLQILKEKNIQNACLKLESYPTIFKNRIIAQGQQIVRIDYENVLPETALIATHIQTLIAKPYDLIILSDYNKGFLKPALMRQIITQARSKNIKTIVDPKSKDWSIYADCFLITPNLKEFRAALGKNIPNEDTAIEKYAPYICQKFNFENMVITRSEKGMSIINSESIKHIPVHATEVFDVSGAGDTVVATLATCLTNGYSLEDSCYYANLAAGFVISKIGTYAISLDQFLSLLEQY